MIKDALALTAFAGWLAVNVWLWAADISIESRFVRSLFWGVVGFAGFFGYLAYRERGRSCSGNLQPRPNYNAAPIS